MKQNRLKDEIISDSIQFLNALLRKFRHTDSVPFYLMGIEDLADKYHINSRLRRMIVSEFFDISKRRYTRKYMSSTWEDMEFVVDMAKKQRQKEYKNKRSTLSEQEIKAENWRRMKVRHEKNKDRVWHQYEMTMFTRRMQASIKKLTNYCKTLTNDYDDLVQTTLLVAIEFKYRYCRTMGMCTWLTTIAKNLNLASLKKMRQRPELLFDDMAALETMSFDPISLDEKHEYEEDDAKHILSAIDELSDNDKKILKMATAKIPYAKIAEETGYAPRYINTRMYLIRKDLAQKISERSDIKVATRRGNKLN